MLNYLLTCWRETHDSSLLITGYHLNRRKLQVRPVTSSPGRVIGVSFQCIKRTHLKTTKLFLGGDVTFNFSRFLRQLKFNYPDDRNRFGATYSPKPFLFLSIFVLGLQWKLIEDFICWNSFVLIFKKMNELKKTGPDISSKTAGVPITTAAHLSPSNIPINRILWALWLSFITIESIKCTF